MTLRLNVTNMLIKKLTPRQSQVFDFIHQGLSNKEIARKLNIAESTVKIHVTAILQQYQLTSVKKLVANTQSVTEKIEPIILNSSHIGWVKKNSRGIRGLMFTKRSPGNGWDPIYTNDKNETNLKVTLEET